MFTVMFSATATPFELIGGVLAIGLMVYLIVSFALIKLLHDRYRSVPAAHVTAAGAAIFVIGIGFLFLSGEQIWDIPLNVALVCGAIGAAIVNVGATMIVGPWLVALVASDLRRVSLGRGPRGTEAQLATSLVRIVSAYGGKVEYDRELSWDFDVLLGRRDLRVELGALSSETDSDPDASVDVVTDPQMWFERMSGELAEREPTDLHPVLIVVNRRMLEWLERHDVGFGEYDANPHFGFQRWDGRASDDAVLQTTVEALLFGITSAASRAAVQPVVPGLGVGGQRTPPRRIAD